MRRCQKHPIYLILASIVGMTFYSQPDHADGMSDIASQVTTASGGESRIFDATLYRDKPDLSAYGIQELPVIYEDSLLKGIHTSDGLPGESRIKAVISGLPGHASILCIDIEHWPLRGDGRQVKSSIDKYIEILRRIRLAGSDSLIGFYGAPPLGDYWRSIKSPGSKDFREWRSDNQRLFPLARDVDVLFPSLYTFYADQDGWRRFAIEQLRAAKRYGKPVYAFIWPQYHESNRLLGGSYIGDDYWRMELDTVRRYADGIVVWGGWDGDGPAKWNDNAAWWRVVKRFIEDGKRESIKR